MTKEKENLSIRLYDILIEEAAFGIYNLEALKEEIISLKNQGAELLWNEKSLVSVGKSTLDIVVISESPELLRFVLDEFVVKQKLDINRFNRNSETALDQAKKIISAKARAEMVQILREYGAKTNKELFANQRKKSSVQAGKTVLTQAKSENREK